MKRLLLLLFTAVFAVFLLSSPALAHSGRTDSSGGHRDNQNASGLGSYHYHHGYGAHLHPNGICPYAPKDTIQIHNQPSSMDAGDRLDLTWTVTYYSGSASVVWSSSDPTVLAADDAGGLRALQPGTATVTATLHNGAKSFKVKVNEVAVSALTLSDTQERSPINRQFSVSCDVQPANATYREIVWSSSAPDIAEVSADGVVTTHMPGTAVIAAKSKGGKTASFSVEVYAILPESVTITPQTRTAILGDRISLRASVSPADTSDPAIVWTSSHPEIAEIDGSGNLVCKQEGDVLITAACQEVSARLPITVSRIHAETVTFDTKAMGLSGSSRMALDEEITPALCFAPLETTLKEAVFTSDSPEIIAVTDGRLVAKGYGTATITATTADTEAQMEITVPNPAVTAAQGGGVLVLLGAGVYLWKRRRTS